MVEYDHDDDMMAALASSQYWFWSAKELEIDSSSSPAAAI